MAAWQDVSSYSRNDKERVPYAWELQVSGVVVMVHRHVHYAADQWLMTCEPWFVRRELVSKGCDEAKSEAIGLLRAQLEATRAALESVAR